MGGSEGLGNMPKVTQLVSRVAGLESSMGRCTRGHSLMFTCNMGILDAPRSGIMKVACSGY